MNKVKVFRVIGEICKPNWKTSFRKEVIAVKPEHAVERVYSELGSKHRIKRFQIKIGKVEEVAIHNIEDPLIRKIVAGEGEIGGQG